MAERRQLAVKLAFAITMHKSQGMSMDGLDIDFAGVFEFGQAYVALSRAVSLENTLLRNFSVAPVKVDPKVVAFYAALVKGGDRAVGTAQQWLSLGKDALGESDAERQQREAERAKDEEAKEKRRALEAKLKEARSRRVGSSFGRDLVLPGER